MSLTFFAVTKIKNSCLGRLSTKSSSIGDLDRSILVHFFQNSEGPPLQDLELSDSKISARIHILLQKTIKAGPNKNF